MKKTRIISTLGLSDNEVSLLRAYCHLLKKQFNERWAFHFAQDDLTDIIFVSTKHIIEAKKQAQFVVTIKKHSGLRKSDSSTNSNFEYTLYEPLTSLQLVKILNSISQVLTSQHQIKEQPKKKFSIKRVLTSFIYGRKSKKLEKYDANIPTKNTATPLTDKLLKLSDPSFIKNLKVVFLGRPGSGKTTAIVSAQTKNLVVCDVNATDSVGLLKEQTTIGIDYCDCNFISGIRLKLFGTPGQGRYNYLQMQTVNRADIYVILVDLTSVAPFSEFQYYNNILESSEANPKAIKLVAFTHYDLKEHEVMVLSNEIKRKCYGNLITAILDPRDRNQVRDILEEMANLSLQKNPSNAVYSQNNNNIINLEHFNKLAKA